MTGNQVKSIMIGSVLVIGGVLVFGKNRRKKLLYQAISDTINTRGGVAVGDDALDIGADTSGCKLSESQTKSIAKKIESSLWGEWYWFWFGTKEAKLKANLRSLKR